MPAVALLLVTIAAVFHACWNLLTKASRDKLVFIWWTGVAGTVLFLPALLWWGPAWSWSGRVWGGLAIGAVIRAAYFAALGAAYTRGDLSLVYPLARGTSPVLVPLVAAIVLGERLSVLGGLGVAAVAVGVYVLHLQGLQARDLLAPFQALRAPHARYAVLTGLLTTTYSIVDKWNINSGISPLPYAYFTIPVAALLLTPVALCRRTIASRWRDNGLRIAAVSLLMTAGYLLVLLALQLAQVSYVAPARELGIVFAALFGSVGLREGYVPQRVTGAAVIVAGVALIGAAA